MNPQNDKGEKCEQHLHLANPARTQALLGLLLSDT